MASHAEIIKDQEEELKQLRRLFDLYFQGFDRVPPVDRRDRVKARLRRLREESSRWNTADRFKIGSIHQKFLTYDRMWERTLQNMEEGRGYRELRRRRRKSRAASEPRVEEPKHTSAANAKESVADDKIKRIYDVYMQAKKRTGERSNLSLEKLRAQLNKQIPRIKAKHGCKDVEFKVVLKNGKAMLKAIPK